MLHRQVFLTINARVGSVNPAELAEFRHAGLPFTSRYRSCVSAGDAPSINHGAFSTTDLSAGQRKRLALVQVYLENRPIIVFDEWAAEQDPTFRRVFYEEILPDLKRQGKALIVISHDDRFFGVADSRLHLHDGKQVAAPG